MCEAVVEAEHAKRVEDAAFAWAASPFHDGEQRFQTERGVRQTMETFGRKVIRKYMLPVHSQFFGEQPFLIVGYEIDDEPWCSILFGPPGFARPTDTVSLDVTPAGAVPPFDPPAGLRLGVLGVDLAARRRNRLNTTVLGVCDGVWKVGVDQTFGNCPQYIQRRAATFGGGGGGGDTPPEEVVDTLAALGARERALVERADTFFVASCLPGEGPTRGADASIRGGRPGFVKILDDGTTLVVPEFVGNNHFNTLGNFAKHPKGALLFLDFDTGAALALTGTVDLDQWSTEHEDLIKGFRGCERAWAFKLTKARWFPPGSVPIAFTPEGVVVASEGNEDPAAASTTEGGGPPFVSPNLAATGSWPEAAAAAAAAAKAAAWRPFRVAKTVAESTVVKSFFLEPADGAGVAPFLAGQYVTLRLSSPDRDKPLVRTYTVSSAPGDAGSYRISVKKEPHGAASSFLHDHVHASTMIDVKAPRGEFFLRADAAQNKRPAVLLAGGIGVTPMISMLRHVVHEGLRTRWSVRKTYFVHVSHDAETEAFREEAAQLAAEAKRTDREPLVVVHSLLSSVDGRLSKATLQKILPLDAYEFYVCGPSGFVQAAYDLLRHELGVRDGDIRSEAFGPSALQRVPDAGATEAAVPQPPAATEAVAVKFAKSHVEQLWTPAQGTLLEFAEAHGLQPDYGCRLGNCGTCKTKLLAGAVTYDGHAAPAIDLEDAHACLICQAVPAADQAGAPMLELDL